MGSVMASAGPPQAMFAGRHTARGLAGELKEGMRAFERGPDSRLVGFLRRHRDARPYAAAIDGSMAAAGYLAKGLPVLPMGGFTSDAPAPTVGGLAGMVRSGELRYVIVAGQLMGKSGPQAVARDKWVSDNCHLVPGFVGGSKLFDCV
ncbi:hypothetical protein ACFQ9X_14675 [Catenulispora yoronensis]